VGDELFSEWVADRDSRKCLKEIRGRGASTVRTNEAEQEPSCKKGVFLGRRETSAGFEKPLGTGGRQCAQANVDKVKETQDKVAGQKRPQGKKYSYWGTGKDSRASEAFQFFIEVEKKWENVIPPSR